GRARWYGESLEVAHVGLGAVAFPEARRQQTEQVKPVVGTECRRQRSVTGRRSRIPAVDVMTRGLHVTPRDFQERQRRGECSLLSYRGAALHPLRLIERLLCRR